MSILFEPFKIGNIIIRNRFMRSATTSYFADEGGFVKDAHIKLYRNLAKGEIGLIVKGHLYVADSGKAHQGMAGISKEEHIDQLKKLTDTVHNNDGKIIAQLNHAGVNHKSNRAGPSYYEGDGWVSRALSNDEIEVIIEHFGSAAERAQKAGFDGVQIHGAHGYLVSQFLSKHINKRDDKWGGSLENRMRLLLKIFHNIRKKVNNAPIMLKLNCDDFSPNGFTINESKQVAKKLAEKGVDLIEISGGGIGRQSNLRDRAKHSDPSLAELDFAGYGEIIHNEIKPTPMGLVSGFKKLQTMQKVVDKGITDIISMSRPTIHEPDLVKKLEAGQKEAGCTRCNACSSRDVFGKTMLRCYLE